MRIKTTISIAMITLATWSCLPVASRAADAALENMRSTVGNSKADLENYRKLLVEFEKARLKGNDQAGATAAKLEIIKLDRELASMDGGSSRRTSRSEAANNSAAEKAAADKAAAENVAAEKAAAAKVAAERVAAEKAAAAKVAAEKVAAEKAATAKAAAERVAAEKAAAAKVAAEKVAAEKAATDKAAAERVAAEKAAAAKAAAEKVAAEKAAAAKAAAAKAAAEEAAAEKALAAAIAAADKAAADKATAEKVAAEKAAADRAAAEKAAALQAAAEKAAAAKSAAKEASATEAADEAKRIADLKSQLRQLIAQGNEKINSGDVQGAREVKTKVNEVQEELTRLSTPAGSATPGKSAILNGHAATGPVQNPVPAPAPAPAPTPVVTPPPAAPAPAPQPLTPILRGPQTQVSSVQGLAGAKNSSKDNVYVFNLSEVGPTATLTYYATGRRSKDTSGNVWLVTPGGHRERVTTWKSDQFEITSPESSYTNLKPVTVDISKLVKGSGAYQIEFEWIDGIAPLVIHRVEITS